MECISNSWKQYVKLVAKPNTWFKEGTEVYDYDCLDLNNKYRISLEQWKQNWEFSGIVCARGIRVSQNKSELHPIGEEYFDGETCGVNEFDMTIVNEK
jgi:hypothetical protein